MASPISVTAVDRLKEQITCSVCLEIFDNPRTLPCLHSFCHGCLERLPQHKHGSKYKINCPSCRTTTELSKAEDFPVAFQINTLKDLYTLFDKASNKVPCENCNEHNSVGYCAECTQFLCTDCVQTHKKWKGFASHAIQSIDEMTSTPTLPPQAPVKSCKEHDKALEIFCETCDKVICQHCTVRIHRDHEYDLVKDCHQKHISLVKAELEPVTAHIKAVSNVLHDLHSQVKNVTHSRDEVKKEIQSRVEEFIVRLKESERVLIKEVDLIGDRHVKELSEKIEAVQESLSQMTDCKKYVEQTLEMGSPQDFLSSKATMLSRMSSITKLVNLEDVRVKEEVGIEFIKEASSGSKLFKLGHVVVTKQSHLAQCKIVPIDDVSDVNGVVQFPLPIKSSSRIPLASLSCHVVNSESQEAIPSNVVLNEGQYIVKCEPFTNGIHVVTVKVNDDPVGETELMVPLNPHLKFITPVLTLTNLDSPYGVAVADDGRIAVAECSSNSVAVLDKDGKKITSLGKNSESGYAVFVYPRGVAISLDNCLLVADNHKIQKVTWDGKLIQSVGCYGSKELQFSTPCGIKTSPLTGKIYIVESSNHRVQVLNQDLTLSFAFGNQGSNEREFTRPRDIAIDCDGFLYVSDAGNHRVQKFTSSGEFVCYIGTPGSGPGQLSRPHGIIIDNNGLLHVAEVANHRVSVFTRDGKFVRSFGEEGNGKSQFKGSGGMSFSKTGQLYICDFYNKRLVVY